MFISKDKIAVLDKNKELAVCNFDGTNVKKVAVNRKSAGGSIKIASIFPAPLGRVTIQTDDALFVYDISARKVISEIQVTDVK